LEAYFELVVDVLDYVYDDLMAVVVRLLSPVDLQVHNVVGTA